MRITFFVYFNNKYIICRFLYSDTFFCYYDCMKHIAYLVKEQSISSYSDDIVEYYNLCFKYPLVFFEKDNIISFFSVDIKLEPKEFNLLLNLVKNKTDKTLKNKTCGIAPERLYKLIGCDINQKNKKAAKDKNHFDKRITRYKSEILSKTRDEFKIFHNPDNKKDFSYKNITETIDGHKTLFGLKIDMTSPYYSFNLNDSLKSLIYSTGSGKTKKYTTDFIFSL